VTFESVGIPQLRFCLHTIFCYLGVRERKLESLLSNLVAMFSGLSEQNTKNSIFKKFVPKYVRNVSMLKWNKSSYGFVFKGPLHSVDEFLLK
jgi:hypothetical protein